MRISKNIIVIAVSLLIFSAAGHGFCGRDPFAPLISPSGRILIPVDDDVAQMRLQGIVFSSEKARAVINGEMKEEGDAIGKYTVGRIERRRVILIKGEEEIILNLEER